ncbi:hypothetical protein QZH56_18600 [Streptomyces olivoreticuli]|uniref:hypothetical protein n=1 Tax=Streptomyces olivoreticuli TaxID=68246 RepID=UPI00265854DE|nr:hypothetical protein [Streptomyces olivoreticuli]WKK20910.1 hypothetical protein QZH56_18600 [Streptomyces olivoreticuli]
MSDQGNYEYFVKATPPYTQERPSSLWRRSGDDWEFLSLLDWGWHKVKGTIEHVPTPEALHRVTAERAVELETDRQGWVRYWAYYGDEEEWRDGEEPTTVVRRRRSPERIYDETFMRDNRWQPDSAVFEFFDARASRPPYLVDISADEADRLLQEIRGVTGATEL